MGMIILLNGVSSAGKSSIAKALQGIWPTPLLELGIDRFISMMPRKYIGLGPEAQQGFQYVSDRDELGPIVHVKSGWLGHKLLLSIPSIIYSLTQHGYDLVVDEVIEGDERLWNYVQLLNNHRVYFIAVVCNIDTLEERERARQNRPVGMARPQSKIVHGPTRVYDFEIDTTFVSPDTSAQQILDFITQNPKPQAFKKLKMLRDGKQSQSPNSVVNTIW